jgi:malonate-semialdehyde dehydrogenase (acetylating)/methylmalonate-semialdehyde dehydrogenase
VPGPPWFSRQRSSLHGHGREAIEFYTEEKVVIEHWPKERSRKF